MTGERAAMIQTFRRATWIAIASAVPLGLPLTLVQAVEVTTSNGWSMSFDGNISAHLIAANASTLGGAPSDVKDTRVTSGWNPSKFNAHVKAPEYDGITVTGNFQYATNITGANNDGFGSTNGNRNLDVDVRVLEADISGAFGTIAIGRGWGIFDSQAILNDVGSGIGTGELCGTPDNWNGGTCGRIDEHQGLWRRQFLSLGGRWLRRWLRLWGWQWRSELLCDIGDRRDGHHAHHGHCYLLYGRDRQAVVRRGGLLTWQYPGRCQRGPGQAGRGCDRGLQRRQDDPGHGLLASKTHQAADLGGRVRLLSG